LKGDDRTERFYLHMDGKGVCAGYSFHLAYRQISYKPHVTEHQIRPGVGVVEISKRLEAALSVAVVHSRSRSRLGASDKIPDVKAILKHMFAQIIALGGGTGLGQDRHAQRM
jgi:hypothetical protein